MVPEDLRYTSDHEWTSLTGENTARMGVTDFAQSQLGEVVFVEFPQVGWSVSDGDAIGTVESVKAVSEVYAPVAGEVVACNAELDSSPELINSDPYGKGWMIEIRLSDPAALDRLMTAEDYRRFIEEA